MCTGTTSLASGCADVSIFQAPVGNTGGLLNAYKDPTLALTLDALKPGNQLSNSSSQQSII